MTRDHQPSQAPSSATPPISTVVGG
jgi:hypothetical protein